MRVADISRVITGAPATRPGTARRWPRAGALLLSAVLSCPGLTGAAETESAYAEAPAAIGRLLIPAIRYEDGYPRHYDEQCTAAVVTLQPGVRSPYLMSAWHCLEDYRDLSRPLTFVDHRGTAHTVRVRTTGGGMDRDWALLELPSPLPNALLLSAEETDAESHLGMVGFPHTNTAATPTLLPACTVTGAVGRDLRTDCVIQRGASGGAVLHRVQAGSARLRYVGVISRGDGVSQSIFVPAASFLRDIRAYLLEAS